MPLNYAIPLQILALTILAFFLLGRGSYTSFGTTQFILRIVVALPLLVSAVFLHFLRTRVTASIIPPFFPERMFLAVLTGIFEIAGSIGLFVPRFHRPAAFWIAIMLVAIFPANIYAAGQVVDGLRFPSVPVRLAMQIVYILLVLMAGFGAPRLARPRGSRV
jgi:uncharacterized membrane protein